MSHLRKHEASVHKILLEVPVAKRAQLVKKIKALGGHYIDSMYFEKTATHFITDKIRVSEKFLGACVRGLWVLSPKYIEDCFEVKLWLEEEDYEYGTADESQSSDLIAAAKSWRWKISTFGLQPFTDMQVALVLESKNSVPYQRLLLYGGAKILKLSLPLHKDKDVSEISLVFMDLSQKMHVKILEEYGLVCLHYMYIVDTIIKNEELDILKYIIRDDTVTNDLMNRKLLHLTGQKEVCILDLGMQDQPKVEKIVAFKGYHDLTMDNESVSLKSIFSEIPQEKIKLEEQKNTGKMSNYPVSTVNNINTFTPDNTRTATKHVLASIQNNRVHLNKLKRILIQNKKLQKSKSEPEAETQGQLRNCEIKPDLNVNIEQTTTDELGAPGQKRRLSEGKIYDKKVSLSQKCYLDKSLKSIQYGTLTSDSVKTSQSQQKVSSTASHSSCVRLTVQQTHLKTLENQGAQTNKLSLGSKIWSCSDKHNNTAKSNINSFPDKGSVSGKISKSNVEESEMFKKDAAEKINKELFTHSHNDIHLNPNRVITDAINGNFASKKLISKAKIKRATHDEKNNNLSHSKLLSHGQVNLTNVDKQSDNQQFLSSESNTLNSGAINLSQKLVRKNNLIGESVCKSDDVDSTNYNSSDSGSDCDISTSVHNDSNVLTNTTSSEDECAASWHDYNKEYSSSRADSISSTCSELQQKQKKKTESHQLSASLSVSLKRIHLHHQKPSKSSALFSCSENASLPKLQSNKPLERSTSKPVRISPSTMKKMCKTFQARLQSFGFSSLSNKDKGIEMQEGVTMEQAASYVSSFKNDIKQEESTETVVKMEVTPHTKRGLAKRKMSDASSEVVIKKSPSWSHSDEEDHMSSADVETLHDVIVISDDDSDLDNSIDDLHIKGNSPSSKSSSSLTNQNSVRNAVEDISKSSGSSCAENASVSNLIAAEHQGLSSISKANSKMLTGGNIEKKEGLPVDETSSSISDFISHRKQDESLSKERVATRTKRGLAKRKVPDACLSQTEIVVKKSPPCSPTDNKDYTSAFAKGMPHAPVAGSVDDCDHDSKIVDTQHRLNNLPKYSSFSTSMPHQSSVGDAALAINKLPRRSIDTCECGSISNCLVADHPGLPSFTIANSRVLAGKGVESQQDMSVDTVVSSTSNFRSNKKHDELSEPISKTRVTASTKRGLAKRKDPNAPFSQTELTIKKSHPCSSRDREDHSSAPVGATSPDLLTVNDADDSDSDHNIHIKADKISKTSSVNNFLPNQTSMEDAALNMIKSTRRSNDLCDGNGRSSGLVAVEHKKLSFYSLADARKLEISKSTISEMERLLKQKVFTTDTNVQVKSREGRSLFEDFFKNVNDTKSESLNISYREVPLDNIQETEINAYSEFPLPIEKNTLVFNEEDNSKDFKRLDIFEKEFFSDKLLKSASCEDYIDLPTPPSLVLSSESDTEDSGVCIIGSKISSNVQGVESSELCFVDNSSDIKKSNSSSKILKHQSEVSKNTVCDSENVILTCENIETSVSCGGWTLSYLGSYSNSYVNKPSLPEVYGQWMQANKEMDLYDFAIIHAKPTNSRMPNCLLLSELVMLAQCEEGGDICPQVITYLYSWLGLHPPVTSETVKLYTDAFDFTSESSVLFEIIRRASELQKSAVLLLEYFISVFEVNFDFCLRSGNKKLLQNCMIVKWLKGHSYAVSPNGTIRQLLQLFEKIISATELDYRACRASCSFLNMACECIRLASIHWDQCNPEFAIDSVISLSNILAKQINCCSDKAKLVVLNMFKPAWLKILVSSKLLLYYNNYLLSDTVHVNKISLSSIVSQFFFLVPQLESRDGSDSDVGLNDLERNSHLEDTAEHLDEIPDLFKSMAHRGVLTASKVNKRNGKGESLIHLACMKNKSAELERLLAVPDADVNLRDNNAWTPLHEACYHGSYACVELLLKYVPKPSLSTSVEQDQKCCKVEIDAAGPEGFTPLHEAVLENRIDVCKLLLSYGGQKLLESKTHKSNRAIDLVRSDEMREVLSSFCESDSYIDLSICNDSQYADVNIEVLKAIAPHSQRYTDLTGSDFNHVASQTCCEEFLTLLMVLVSSYYSILGLLERNGHTNVSLDPKDKLVLANMDTYFKLLKRHVRKLTRPDDFEQLQFHLKLLEDLCISGPAKV